MADADAPFEIFRKKNIVEYRARWSVGTYVKVTSVTSVMYAYVYVHMLDASIRL